MTDQNIAVYEGVFSNMQAFENAQRMAQAITNSTIFPEAYRGSDNVGNALIALDMAQRLGIHPLMVAQNIYVVHGRPSWSARGKAAIFNQNPRYSDIEYEIVGNDAFANDYRIRAKTRDKRATDSDGWKYGPWIDWKLVRGERWDQKSGSKWLTMPEKMFRYRAASWLIDVVAPEISMGLPTAEEAAEIIDVDPVTGEVIDEQSSIETLQEKLREGRKRAADEVESVEPEPQPDRTPDENPKPEPEQAPGLIDDNEQALEPETKPVPQFNKNQIIEMINEATVPDSIDDVLSVISDCDLPSRTKGSLISAAKAKALFLRIGKATTLDELNEIEASISEQRVTKQQEGKLLEELQLVRDCFNQDGVRPRQGDSPQDETQVPVNESEIQPVDNGKGLFDADADNHTNGRRAGSPHEVDEESFESRTRKKFAAFIGLIEKAPNRNELDKLQSSVDQDEQSTPLEKGFLKSLIKKEWLAYHTMSKTEIYSGLGKL